MDPSEFDPRTILAEGLSAAIEASAKPRTTIAQEAQISLDHLSRLMKGRANPSAFALFGLAESLGWRISEIFAEEEAQIYAAHPDLALAMEPELEKALSGLWRISRTLRTVAFGVEDSEEEKPK